MKVQKTQGCIMKRYCQGEGKREERRQKMWGVNERKYERWSERERKIGVKRWEKKWDKRRRVKKEKGRVRNKGGNEARVGTWRRGRNPLLCCYNVRTLVFVGPFQRWGLWCRCVHTWTLLGPWEGIRTGISILLCVWTGKVALRRCVCIYKTVEMGNQRVMGVLYVRYKRTLQRSEGKVR